MNLHRIRLTYVVGGFRREIVGWWPSTSAALLTAQIAGGEYASAIVMKPGEAR